MDILNYKGYLGELGVDLEAGILFGRVINTKDTITFQSATVAEGTQAFHDSVDDYLAFCKKLNREPDKPLSGRILFRTTPERHRDIFRAAKLAGKSVNEWMEEILSAASEGFVRERTRQPESHLDTKIATVLTDVVHLQNHLSVSPPQTWQWKDQSSIIPMLSTQLQIRDDEGHTAVLAAAESPLELRGNTDITLEDNEGRILVLDIKQANSLELHGEGDISLSPSRPDLSE